MDQITVAGTSKEMPRQSARLRHSWNKLTTKDDVQTLLNKGVPINYQYPKMEMHKGHATLLQTRSSQQND